MTSPEPVTTTSFASDDNGPEKRVGIEASSPIPVRDPEKRLIDSDDWRNWHLTLRKCLAEFVGVFLFVFVGALSFSIHSSAGGQLSAAFAHGFTIVIMIISLGHVSGGHFNPVITLGVLISGKIQPVLALLYIITHLVSAILSAFSIKAVLTNYAYCYIAGGTTNPHVIEETIPQGILLEMILTYLLVQSVLNAAIDSDGKNLLAALAIGMSVLVDVLAGGNKSGASMNIARSFGPAVAYSALAGPSYISPSQVWAAHYVDWVGPILGAILAAIVYKVIFTSHESWVHFATPQRRSAGLRKKVYQSS